MFVAKVGVACDEGHQGVPVAAFGDSYPRAGYVRLRLMFTYLIELYINEHNR